MTTEQATREILQSPDAPRLLRAMNEAMEQERRAREEFYERIQPGDKWEFINGEIVMHSPARHRHNLASSRLRHLIQTHLDAQQVAGVLVAEKALTTFSRNDYEPDIAFFAAEKAGRINPEDWKYPIPDLIVEILSPSTEAADRGIKFRDYAHHGVEEYWIVDPDRETVEQYLLRDGQYELLAKGDEVVIKSHVLKGLRLPARAIFDDQERRRVMAEMLKG